MNLKKEKVLEYLEKSNDLVDTMLVLRLYDEYNKILNEHEKLKVTLIDIKIACNKINKKISNKQVEQTFDSKFYDSIISYNLLLNNYLNNLDIYDKNKIQDLIDVITYLECLLSMPLSFPKNAENCLNKKIKNI